MDKQNKIISLRNLDRVGQRNINFASGETPKLDLQENLQEKLKNIEPYKKNGLEYINTLPFIISRDSGGNIKIQKSETDNDLINQNFIIEPNTKIYFNDSIINTIDTQFKYFNFPPNVITNEIDINETTVDISNISESLQDFETFAQSILEQLNRLADAAEDSQSQFQSTSSLASGGSLNIISVYDNIYERFHGAAVAGIEYSNNNTEFVIRYKDEFLPPLVAIPRERLGFNWPDNKFLLRSDRKINERIKALGLVITGVIVLAAGTTAAIILSCATIGAGIPAAIPIMIGTVTSGGALITAGIVGLSGPVDGNGVTIRFEVSGTYLEGRTAENLPAKVRALFVKGTSDSNEINEKLYNKAKNADKDINAKNLVAGKRYQEIEIPAPKTDDNDLYLVVELGSGDDAKKFTTDESTRVKFGPINMIRGDYTVLAEGSENGSGFTDSVTLKFSNADYTITAFNRPTQFEGQLLYTPSYTTSIKPK